MFCRNRRLDRFSVRVVTCAWLPWVVALCAACTVPTEQEASPRGPLGKADNLGACRAELDTDHCGGKSLGSCWCDEACDRFGDCCGDVEAVCRRDSSVDGGLPDAMEATDGWARSITATGSVTVSDIERSSTDELAVVGGFYGVATFGIQQETSKGQRDLYVTRLSSQGDFLWSTRIGTPGHDLGHRVATLGATTVILGEIDADANWGDVQFYQGDRFLAAFDGSGALLWKTRLGRWRDGYEGSIRDADLSVLSDGSIVVVGGFTGWVDLGDGTNLVAASKPRGLFIARYSAGGSYQRATALLPESRTLHSFPITDTRIIAGEDDSYTVAATVLEGSYLLAGSPLPRSGGSDILVARFSSSDQVVWANFVGGVGDETLTDLALDLVGDPLISGYWEGKLASGESCVSHELFRTDLGGPQMVSQYCGIRAFAAAYDGGSGAHRWSTTIAGNNDRDYYGVSIVASGSESLLLGSFNGRLSLGDELVDNSNGLGNDYHDLFLVRLSAEGDPVDGEAIPGLFAGEPVAGRALVASEQGTPIIGASFYSEFATPTATLSAQPGGGSDSFVSQW